MITVSIDINGRTIYARTAVNRVAETGKYMLDTGEQIEHDPADGTVVLAKKMLDSIVEIK